MSDSASPPSPSQLNSSLSSNATTPPPPPPPSNSQNLNESSPAPESSPPPASSPPPPPPSPSPPPPKSSSSPPPPKAPPPPPPHSPPPASPQTSPPPPLNTSPPPSESSPSPELPPPPASPPKNASPPSGSPSGDNTLSPPPPPPPGKADYVPQAVGGSSPTDSKNSVNPFPSPNIVSQQYPTPGTAPQLSTTVPSPLIVKRPLNVSPPPITAKAPAPLKANGSSNASTAKTVSEVMGGMFIITFIAVLFVVRRKRRKQPESLPPHNVSPNDKPGEFFYGQNPSLGHSGSLNPFYGAQPKNPSPGNNYGIQGQVYYGGGPDSGVISSTKSVFSYEEVMEMTNGFLKQNVIGEGGFGCVYKGWQPDGKMVAVKQLKAGSGQGEREFRAEVEIISRVHHRHLVSLVGYCIAEKQRLLIYEFVPNNTLEHQLHGKGLPVLDWTNRVKIALGAAKGLAYLHEDCHPKIIHRDIKSANILLDDAFEAQVADFGLAKLTNDAHTHVSTRVMGTFGYLAPEYASSGKLTDRSDVFSFGVVLLELITGRKPVDPTQPLGDESLVEWARPVLIHALETGDFSELVDPRLEKHYVESELFRMTEAAAACVRHSAQKRPRMAKVVRALDSDDEFSDLSNGVKYGQSTAYDSGQYNQDILRLQKMAMCKDDSSEFDIYSGEYNSRELSSTSSSWKSEGNSSGLPSCESRT